MEKVIINRSEEQIDINAIIVEDFNTPLSAMDRSSIQKPIRTHWP